MHYRLLKSERPSELKLVNINPYSIVSDAKVLQKIRNEYFNERGNWFFNWVY